MGGKKTKLFVCQGQECLFGFPANAQCGASGNNAGFPGWFACVGCVFAAKSHLVWKKAERTAKRLSGKRPFVVEVRHGPVGK